MADPSHLEPELQEVYGIDDLPTDDNGYLARHVERCNELLKDIKSQCKANPNHLWESNLGDLLHEFDLGHEMDRGAGTHPLPGSIRTAMLEFLIEKLKETSPDQGVEIQAKLGTKLDERGSSRLSLLDNAVERLQTDDAAILLASGASPDLIDELEMYLDSYFGKSIEAREIGDLFDFNQYIKEHGGEDFSVLPTSSDNNLQLVKYVKDLLNARAPWLPHADSTTDCCAWIDVKSANGLILIRIFRAILNRYRGMGLLVDSGSETLSALYSTFSLPSVMPGNPLLTYREPGYGAWKHTPGTINIPCTSIVFPFFLRQPMQEYKHERRMYTNLRREFSTLPLGEYSAGNTIHTCRTLDETYYPGLSADDLEERNHDQVISRNVRKTWPRNDHDPELLMIPQLWLWRFASSTPDADQQIASVLSHLVKAFPPPLEIFETSVTDVLSDVHKYMKQTKPSNIDYLKEHEMFHELSDIRSELAMIQEVLEQQNRILDNLLNDQDPDEDTKPTRKDHHDNQRTLREIAESAQRTIGRYERRINKIDSDAERVEKVIQSQLDLKRAYASVKDAHSSLLLGTAVIGFTIVTIIFAPLAFLTALFALNIDGFDRLKNDDGAYSSAKMGGIFVGSEVLTILLTGVLVFAALWYINQMDRIKESNSTKHSGLLKKEAKPKNKTERLKESKSDIESQGMGFLDPNEVA